MRAVNVQNTKIKGHSSREDYASDILRGHYGTLSQSLDYPIKVAQLLCGERVISQTMLSDVKIRAQSPSEKEAIFLLLKAVRHAVHTNYHNLEVFASALLKFTCNVPCAKAILKDYSKYIMLLTVVVK